MSIKGAVLAVLAAENHGQPSPYGDLDNKLYLLAQLSGEDFGYQLELHGPRSSSVSAEIRALVEGGFVEERSSCAVGDGPSPALVRSYVLTDVARTVLPSVRQRLEPYAAYVARLNANPSIANKSTLSALTKVLAALSQITDDRQDEALTGRVRDGAAGFGWELDEQSVRDSLDHLTDLGLASSLGFAVSA